MQKEVRFMSIIGVKCLTHVLKEIKENRFDYSQLSPGEMNTLFNGYVAGMRDFSREGGSLSNSAGKKAMNVIGGCAPLDCDGEFSKVTAATGIAPVRHISDCSRFEAFYF